MDINNIQDRYKVLSADLKRALSTMELSEKVLNIRQEIKDLQTLCPHNVGSYDYSQSNECPYCGKRFKG